MPITEQDIKLLASQRMTDTADGGGRMTGNVVQSGVDNNIFDDVSNLDRVYGNVSLRKVFAAVLTNDTDKYLGARVVIDQPPEDPNVQCVMFAASSQFDNRTGATVKVESYLAPGPAYQGLLYGDHLAGMASVMLIQQTDRELPSIGQVLLLRKDGGLPGQVDQYVRITSVTSTPSQRFTDSAGDFTRTVVTCTISDPLRAAFPGFPAVRVDAGLDFTGRTAVMESVVADASQYFGIRPLEVSATAGDIAIKCDTVYTALLPSAQIETPIPDARTNGLSQAVAAAGGPVEQVITGVFSPSQALFVGGGIAPGTLSVVREGITLTDSGGSLLQGSTAVGAVDYASGILSLQTDVFGAAGGTHTVGYTPAFAVQVVPKSVGIDVTPEGRSYSYVTTLTPTPTQGSLVVSYLSGGRWYTLRDTGTGAVVGSTPALGAGTVNFTTGTLSVTLGALPDVGSAIILQWAEAAKALALPEAMVSTPAIGGVRRLATTLPLHPGMVITWDDGAAKSATLVGNSITGDAVGVAVPSQGHVVFMPLTLPPPGTVFSATYDNFTGQVNALTLPTGTLPGAPIRPGSLRFDVLVNITHTLTGTAKAEFGGGGVTKDSTATLSVGDDGVGNLLIHNYLRGSCAAGTVDYATGAVSLNLGTPYGVDYNGPGIHLTNSAGNQEYYPWHAYPAGSKSVSWAADAQSVSAHYSGTSSAPGSLTHTPTSWDLGFSTFWGHGVVGARFSLGADTYAQDGANLRRNINPSTGVGSDPVGTVSGSALAVTVWQPGVDNTLVGFAAGQQSSTAPADSQFGSAAVVFRTAGSPLRVGSFSVVGQMLNGATFNVTADEFGKIDSTNIKGVVDYQTGVVRLWGTASWTSLGVVDLSAWGFAANTNVAMINTASLRYNAVAYSYLPLDASILGLDPVRLPQDGRVPVFKAGRVVLVHNTQRLAPQTVSNGQTVTTGRTLLSKLRVWGDDGLEITTGWAADLDAGTVTFSSVAGYSQPVTVEHRVEDEALCLESQITGDLRLSRTLTHDYPAPGSYVSSSYVMGTLQAAAQDSFAQEAWLGEWSDVPSGLPVLASYNDVANPIAVTNAGAITEQWACIFTNSTTFNLVGSQLGQILTGSTGAVLSPVNPATGVPYFTLQPAGWGSGWAAGNVLRFNTTGAARPLWLARTVLQSPAAPPGTDQITISIMGDIDQ